MRSSGQSFDFDGNLNLAHEAVARELCQHRSQVNSWKAYVFSRE